MPTSLTFTAFTPPQPAGRRWDLWSMLPEKNREEDATGDLAKFIACLQDVIDLALYRVDTFSDIWDYDRAPVRYLPHILHGLGNPFTSFALEEIDERRLASQLVSMYEQKGTDAGIINVVRFFVGIEVTIRTYYRDEVWEVDDDDLGTGYIGTTLDEGTAEVGPDATADQQRWRLGFEVVSPVALTAQQRTDIQTLVGIMKPTHTFLIAIVEP